MSDLKEKDVLEPTSDIAEASETVTEPPTAEDTAPEAVAPAAEDAAAVEPAAEETAPVPAPSALAALGEKLAKRIKLGFGGTFWPGIFILVILLIISFVVLGFRMAEYANRDNREVMLKSNMDMELDIFSATYKNEDGEIVIRGAEGEKVIAPGADVDYTVRLRNKDNVAIDYTLIANVKVVGQKGIEIPLEFRILDPEDNYLAGDAKTWVTRAEIDGLSHNSTIKRGESAEYIFQWRWPFEGSNDQLDTILGNMADLDLGVEISFTLRSEANTSLEANGGFWGSGLGRGVLIFIFALLLLIAIILLIIAYFKRKQIITIPEPVVVPEPVVEPEPMPEPTPEPEPIIIRYSIADRKHQINLDTLSAHFEDGDKVNLAALKAKGLVPASTKQIKVLARNSAVLNKAFHIEAQAASATAKRAVEAAGGSITIVRPE